MHKIGILYTIFFAVLSSISQLVMISSTAKKSRLNFRCLQYNWFLPSTLPFEILPTQWLGWVEDVINSAPLSLLIINLECVKTVNRVNQTFLILNVHISISIYIQKGLFESGFNRVAQIRRIKTYY